MKFKLKYLSVIGVLIVLFILSRINFIELKSILKNINPVFLIIAFCFSILGLIGNFLRWQYTLRSLGINISTKKALIFSFKSIFAENSPGKIGEPILKAAYLKKESNTSYSQALFSTFLHKLIDILAGCVQALLVIIILFFVYKINLMIVLPTLLLFVILIMFIFIIKNDQASKFINKIIGFFIFGKNKESYKNKIHEILFDFKKIKIKLIIMCLIIDLVVVLLTAFSLYFTSLAINQTIPFFHMILLVPLISIASGLPISIAGAGPREVIFIYYFTMINIPLPNEIGITIGILQFIFKIITMIPGIFISFFEKDSGTEMSSD
jgi:uncharacterized protein (TIRG00374 family)